MKKYIISVIFFLCSTAYSSASLHSDYHSRNVWHSYYVKHFTVERVDSDPPVVYVQSYIIGRTNLTPNDVSDIPDIEYDRSTKTNVWSAPPIQDGWLYVEPVDSK